MVSHRQRLTGCGGFTLIEAMIATVILAFVLTSVLAVASQAARLMANVRWSAQSSQIVQRKAEELRSLTWAQVQSLPTTFTDATDSAGKFQGLISTAAYDSYNGSTTVMRVTISVTWTNKAYRVQTNSVTTLVTNSGLNSYVM
jgi:Tfp pilus assembly protein PilV